MKDSYITMVDDETGEEVDYTEEEYEALVKQEHQEEAEARARLREEGQRLVGDLGRAYKAYESFVKENPGVALDPESSMAVHRQICDDLLTRLKKAELAPRCGYIKVNGSACGSPRMKGKELCYAHDRWAAVRPQKIDLPPMEDANSIQVGLMHVARGLLDGQLEPKTAGLILRCLQIASSNVDNTNFWVEEE